MTTEKARFLTKEEELNLGGIIQKHYKAKDILEEDSQLVSGSELSSKEIQDLETIIAEGKEAVKELVEANVGLVYKQANNFKNRYPAGPEFSDTLQAGMEGLMTAIRKYDPIRGNKFSTVAYYWIAQAIGRNSNKTSRLVRLPENRINDLIKMNRISSALEDQDLSWAELDAIMMNELNLSENDLVNIRSAATTPTSLNKPVGSASGFGERELIDFVSEDNASISSEEQFLDTEMRQVLIGAVYSLEPRKRDVMLARFSIGDKNDLSSSKVRDKYKLNSSHMVMIEAEAVAELQESFKNKGLSFADFADSI